MGGTRVYSDLNAVTGNKSFEITFNDGSPNAIQITEFRFGVSATGVTELKPVDFTQASYLQFYINNTMGTELQLDVIDLGNNGNYASIKSDVEVDFYNTTTEEWSKSSPRRIQQCIHLHTDCTSDNRFCPFRFQSRHLIICLRFL